MIPHPFTVELTDSLRPGPLGFDMTVGDDNAHEISIDVTNNGTPYDMTGGTAGLYVIRPDGVAVWHVMTIATDNLSVSVSQQACAYPGRVLVFVKLALGGDTANILYRYGTVRDGVVCSGTVDAGDVLPSLEDVLAAVADTEAATALTLDAIQTITGLTLEAVTLDAGESATAAKEIDDGDGHINLVFGLPRGAQGIQGVQGDPGDQGPKGDPGDPLIILGTYADLAALRTAVPSPTIGDMYNVGAAAPYNIHRATGLANPNDWEDQGTLQATTDAEDMDITDAGNYYTSGTVEGALQEVGLGKVDRSLFDAHTILAATADNTPAALTVAEQTVIGRLTGGSIDDIPLGIADNNVVQIDHDSVTDDDFARFTANGLEGRSASEVKADLDLEPGTDIASLDANAKVAATQASAYINAQTDSYTLVLSDAGKMVKITKDTAATVTIPLYSSVAFPIGTEIEIVAYGAGAVTIAATSGVTLHSAQSNVVIAQQYASVAIKHMAQDEWLLTGYLS